jgi:gluconolactonase
MSTRIISAFAVLSLLSVLAHAQDLANKPIEGLGPVGEIKKLFGDFEFTEGPAFDMQGNLYLSDIPASKIYKVDPAGNRSVFLEDSKHTNGLMVAKDGKIYACEMDGRLVSIDPASKAVAALSEGYEGKRYNAPNDLVIDAAGGVYFTDPHFRAPMPLPQGTTAVYYRSPEGKVTRLTSDPKAPNGVILSPDEKTLYVIPSGEKKMYAYNVKSPGVLGEAKVFCELEQAQPNGNGGGDGLAIDVKGNLYITSGLGMQVFSPAGKLLGIIKFPEQPANATFGGKDNKTLYVTARKGLYSCEMPVAGHTFARAK